MTETGSGMDLDLDSKPDGYIILCTTFHIAQTRTRIPTHYFCTGQESESESVPESVSGSVNGPKRMIKERPTWWKGGMQKCISFVILQQAGLQPTFNEIQLFSYHLPKATLSNILVSNMNFNTVYFWNRTFLFLDNRCCLVGVSCNKEFSLQALLVLSRTHYIDIRVYFCVCPFVINERTQTLNG